MRVVVLIVVVQLLVCLANLYVRKAADRAISEHRMRTSVITGIYGGAYQTDPSGVDSEHGGTD